jgi:hypothetical protein
LGIFISLSLFTVFEIVEILILVINALLFWTYFQTILLIRANLVLTFPQ